MPPQPMPTLKQLRYRKVLAFMDELEDKHTAQIQILAAFYGLGFMLLLMYVIYMTMPYLVAAMIVLGIALMFTMLFTQPFLQYAGIREQVAKDLEEGIRLEA